MMRLLIALFVPLLTGLAGLPGCGGPERVTLALFDTSGSVDTEVLHDRYTGVIEQLLGALGPGDRILAGRITDRSLAEPLAFEEALQETSLLDNAYRARDSMAAARTRAEAGARAVLEAPAAPCTDLLGALDAAGRRLVAQSEAERRLVLVSDMVQTCDPLDLLHADLSTEAVDAFIRAEREGGRLPALDGVQVWVAGAGTEPRLDRTRRAEVERFWRAYLGAAGAELPPHRYGPDLLDWP